MKRYVEFIIICLIMAVIASPCLLTFDESAGKPTIINAVGLLYAGSLICIIKRIARR